MLRSAVAAACAAVLLGVPVPAAHADTPTYDCEFDVATPGPGTWTGPLRGYAVHADGTPVSITCLIEVDGVERARTTGGAYGPALSMAYGVVTFAVSPASSVRVCSFVTYHTGSSKLCWPVAFKPVPPQEVVDLADFLVDTLTALPCVVLREIGSRGLNVLGLVRVEPDGDLYVNGSRFVDC